MDANNGHPSDEVVEHVMDRAGSRIHAWVSGPASGPAIVWTHGATMDHRMFDPQVGPLVAAGYRVITWDLRGHGRSQPLGDPPVDVPAFTEDLAALLDDLGVTGRLCIAGQSLGGYVAQEFLRRHPERVSSLVIVGSTCTTGPLPWWEHAALLSSTWWFAPWPWGHLKRIVATSTAARPDVQAYAEEAIGQMKKADFLQVWRGLTRSIRPDPDHRIEVPLLLTHGDRDRTGNVARTAPAWAEREAQCRYVVIPGASHNANQDNPAFFNRVLLEFLSEYHPARA